MRRRSPERRVPSKDHVETAAFGRPAMGEARAAPTTALTRGAVTHNSQIKPAPEPQQSTVLVRT